MKLYENWRASPVTEISAFATEISATELKIFPYEHSSPVTAMKFESSPLVHPANRASPVSGLI